MSVPGIAYGTRRQLAALTALAVAAVVARLQHNKRAEQLGPRRRRIPARQALEQAAPGSTIRQVSTGHGEASP
eukprot:3933897-Rhodomonas_salina.7